MMLDTKSKRGSFSVFISIMMSSMIFLMSILLHATVISGRRMMVQTALIQQQDLLLSHYSEMLEDRYGLFAAKLSGSHEESFFTMTGRLADLDDYRVYGIDELTGPILFNNIINYSKPRFPVQAAAGFLDRMNIIQSNLSQSRYTIPAAGSGTKDSDNNDGSAGIGFDEILSMLVQLKPEQSVSGDGDNPEDMNQSFSEISNLLSTYDTKDIFETDISRTIKSDLTISEKTLNKMSDFVEKFYAIESDDIYDRLTFEFYVNEMFSCKVNYRTVDNEKIYRKDMRGRSFEILLPSSEPEIEKTVFGFEEDDKNVFFTKCAIQGIRFVSNLIANMTDSKKRAGIKSLAATICVLVAVASEGTIVISQETAEAIVTVIKSTSQAVSDYRKLMDGGCVDLLPIEETIKIETCYRDYLGFMLLTVPKDVKLARIESIIKKNTAGMSAVLFTGIGISCRYRGHKYFCEKGYFDGAE
ncbi:MAG: DUF5702 domain-containing protein [Saccharofermentanales bacterium]